MGWQALHETGGKCRCDNANFNTVEDLVWEAWCSFGRTALLFFVLYVSVGSIELKGPLFRIDLVAVGERSCKPGPDHIRYR